MDIASVCIGSPEFFFEVAISSKALLSACKPKPSAYDQAVLELCDAVESFVTTSETEAATMLASLSLKTKAVEKATPFLPPPPETVYATGTPRSLKVFKGGKDDEGKT